MSIKELLKSAEQNQGLVEWLLDASAKLRKLAELLAVSDITPRKPKRKASKPKRTKPRA